MKQCAIILNGKDVVKVANLKRKYNKLTTNPEIKILEECNEDELEEKYSYWVQTLLEKKDTTDKSTDRPLRYHWRNKNTGWTRHSVNPELGKDADPDEWESYEID